MTQAKPAGCRLAAERGAFLGALRDFAGDGLPRLLRNPSPQFGQIKFKPKARLGLAFDAPRTSVMNTIASQIMKRPIQVGFRRGGLAPTTSENPKARR